jgi:peptide/nickel transport system substrate-binding protein
MGPFHIRRFASLLLAFFIVTVTLASCGAPPRQTSAGASPAAGQQSQGEKVLIVAVPGDIDTFDPAFTVGTRTSQMTIQNTFDQLDQYKLVEQTGPDGYKYWAADTSEIEPMLAESRTISEDGKTVVWKLRDNITYHDGKPVTAQDIVEGYRRIYEAQGISYWLLTMGGVMEPDYFKVPDDKTVEMQMDTPNELVLMNNVMHNTSAISPEHLKQYATDADPWGKEQLKKTLAPGNGPFVFEEYRPGDRVVLRAYPDYYRGRPKLDKVILKIVPDATQRLLLLKKGEVDMVEDPPVKELDSLKEDPNIRVLSIETPRSAHLQMNHEMAPFDNKLVRQAVAYAVPYDSIVNDVYKGYATRSMSLVTKGMPGHDPSFWTYSTDLEKAKELLAEAGHPNGQGLPPIKLSVRVGNEEEERMAIFIANNLKQIGMNVTVDKIAFATFNEQQQAGNLQFFVDYWISWVNDPFYHLSWIVRSDSPTNYNNYQNEQVDQLIEEFTLSTDEEGRLEAAKEIQQILAEDVAHVYLVQPTWNVPLRKNITGYAYLNDELPRFFYMDKE